ncbi:MAG: hypothetical protein ABJC36_08185 [Gemmatimonadales bacterium]
MSRRHHLTTLALLALVAGCSDRADPGPTEPGAVPPAPADHATTDPSSAQGIAAGGPTSRAAQERLARRFALALGEPGFRAYVKDALDRSSVREHKLQLQHFLGRADGAARAALAHGGGDGEASVDRDARSTISLEVYLPVAAQRATWTGGDDILVATARDDGESPVAFDIRGHRRLLDPRTPPSTPVLAVVPVEADFSADSIGLMLPEDGGGGGGGGGGGSGGTTTPTPPAGLYLTSAHFVEDFEGWLKGSPEYEIHVLGQSGASDSLTSYQCVGEHAGGSYAFDQNNLDWTGNVLLFSQTQLTSYKTAHPNQNVRIVAIEDDDGACQIRLDGNRFKAFQTALQNSYPNLTGGKDSTSGLARVFKRANALQRILRAAYSWITSQDDLIGNAIENSVVNEYHGDANWIVRGENNVTNGWLKLQMR